MKHTIFFLWFVFLILVFLNSWSPVLASGTYSAEIEYIPKYIGADESPFLVYLNFQGEPLINYKFSVAIRDKENFSVKSQIWNSAEQKWQGGYSYQEFTTGPDGEFNVCQAMKINVEIDTSRSYEIFYRIKDISGQDLITVQKDSGFQIIDPAAAGWLAGHIKSLNDRYNNKLVVITDTFGEYVSSYWCENNGIEDYDYNFTGDGYFKFALPSGSGYKIKAYEAEEKFWETESIPIWEGSESYNIEAGKITSIDPNQPPAPILNSPLSTNKKVVTDFNGSASFDPEGAELSYYWDFGDGNFSLGEGSGTASHIFEHCGKYIIKLKVSDGELEQAIEKEMTVLDVFISEILPSPVGSDAEEEWIEFYNDSDFEGDLAGWIISDLAGSTKEYALPSPTIIRAKSFLLIKRIDSKISLNNEGDGAILFLINGQEVNRTEYTNAQESFSWAYFGDSWKWTASPTPSATNFYYYPADVIEAEEERAYYRPVNVSDCYSLSPGEKVEIFAQVIAQPGNFAKTYFYVQDKSSGIRIHQYRGDFPALNLGDWIIVSGEINDYRGQRQIKISDREKIRIANNHKHQLIPPIYIDSFSKLPAMIYRIIKISGKVDFIGESSLRIESGEIKLTIYLKSLIDIDLGEFDISAGDEIDIIGFLIPYNNGYRLLPRNRKDIVVKYIDNDRYQYDEESEDFSDDEKLALENERAGETLFAKDNNKVSNIIRNMAKTFISTILPIEVAKAASSEKGTIKGASAGGKNNLANLQIPGFFLIVLSLVWQIFLRKPT